MARIAWFSQILTAALTVLPPAATASAMEIGPDNDWCAALRALPPGHELVLRPGQYRGNCTIRRGGTPGAPLVVRARDPNDPPRIVYAGRAANALNIRASHVVVRGLAFGPTAPNVDGIRIYGGEDITIEGCRFTELGGIAVVSNHSSVRGLTVRGNEIVRSRATAMYFGCHDGEGCVVSNLLVADNYVEGVDAPDGEIGYGVQVKLNSTATIRDNVILDTKGPGIMVYGARDAARASLVERNLVSGSRTSSAIVLGGGPVVVRNNLALRSAEAGISLQDYGSRGLLRGVVVVHNTVYGNGRGGITLPAHGDLDAKLVNNAVQAPPGTAALPGTRPGLLDLGNADCRAVPCFADAEAWDFSPRGPRPGVLFGAPSMPVDDYLGRARGAPPIAGALEGPAGAIPPRRKGSRP